jgi:hypothetical protein
VTNRSEENYRVENPFNLHYINNEINEYGNINELETMTTVSEDATVRTAFIAGNKDENSLTNIIFFSRHQERNNQPIKKHETKEAREWIDIRDKIVRPILAELKKKNQSSPASTSQKDKGQFW